PSLRLHDPAPGARDGYRGNFPEILLAGGRNDSHNALFATYLQPGVRFAFSLTGWFWPTSGYARSRPRTPLSCQLLGGRGELSTRGYVSQDLSLLGGKDMSWQSKRLAKHVQAPTV